MAIEYIQGINNRQELFIRALNSSLLEGEDQQAPLFTDASSKLAHHPEIIQDLVNNKPRIPISMEVDISYICGDSCRYCHFAYTHEEPFNPKRNNIPIEVIEQKFMHPTLAEKIFAELAESGVKSVVFSGGGEPLDSPYALEIFNIAKTNNLRMGMYTRGFGLKGDLSGFVAENFDWVVVSLDATNPTDHKEIKGTGASVFGTKVRNIKDFLRWQGRHSNISVSCMVGSTHLEVAIPYLDQLPFVNLKSEGITRVERDMLWLLGLGVDEVQIRPIVDTGSYEEQTQTKEVAGMSYIADIADQQIWQQHYSWIPPMIRVLQKYRNVPGINVSLDKFVDLYAGISGFKTCDAMFVSAGLIETDGNVAKCVNLRKITSIGNLKEQSLKDIFLSDHLDRSVNELCRAGCRGCKVNIFMEMVRTQGQIPATKEPGKHPDFI